MPASKPIEDQIKGRICHDEKTGCWEWNGAKTSAGYGQIRHKNKALYVHIIMYKKYHGEDSKGREVLHKCDNPSCVNPDHLCAGSHLDNMHDAMKKGRINATPLSDRDVMSIRERHRNGERQCVLAREYGTHESYVSRLVRGERRNVTAL